MSNVITQKQLEAFELVVQMAQMNAATNNEKEAINHMVSFYVECEVQP